MHCDNLTINKKGDIVHTLRIILDTTESVDILFMLKKFQFPVRLIFAMMINKPQGQCFDKNGRLPILICYVQRNDIHSVVVKRFTCLKQKSSGNQN